MLADRVKFEERLIDEVYNSRTLWFSIDKDLLEEMCGAKFPEAVKGTISISYPADNPIPFECICTISPTKIDEYMGESDYDVMGIDLSDEDIESLIALAGTEEK